MKEPSNEPELTTTEKQTWEKPLCEDLDDIEIAGGAGPAFEADSGAIS